ncbi:hypothetical protein [Phenylobacterium sp.]|uniref:hypothetical protein n=1 Tax=Phenylobacterium sp. TaxID=1871053 RepID=UPI00391941ED
MDASEAANRLQARRTELLQQVEGLQAAIRSGGSSERDDMLAQAQAELTQIDSALLGAANTEALNREAAAREAAKAAGDDAGFWFRRFMLSLQIGNGAGLAATLAGLQDTTDQRNFALLVVVPAQIFATGLITSGALPALLWAERLPRLQRTWARPWIGALIYMTTISSALMFVGGVVEVINGLWGVARG